MGEPDLPDLSRLHDALNIVCNFLDAHRLPYAVAGGLAVAIWGEPRATYDVDLVVAADVATQDDLLAAIHSEPAFLLDPQVLPMPPEINIVRAHLIDKKSQDPTIILVDFLLLSAAFSATLRQRRVSMTVAGQLRSICSCEDLIVLKLLSGRVKDLEDVRGIRRVQQGTIDESYVQKWAARLNCEDSWRTVTS